ncbi:hypothetical protein QVD17_28638 [Tagetes erecta]|uniref:Uncharacterized protein n=1 Tax=Tagetes erecta TaxID=13708 RepID=A0AAD8KAS3_TARER|nr:hypothetical protein QVD17_28638 [Tagetes erecta]
MPPPSPSSLSRYDFRSFHHRRSISGVSLSHRFFYPQSKSSLSLENPNLFSLFCCSLFRSFILLPKSQSRLILISLFVYRSPDLMVFVSLLHLNWVFEDGTGRLNRHGMVIVQRLFILQIQIAFSYSRSFGQSLLGLRLHYALQAYKELSCTMIRGTWYQQCLLVMDVRNWPSHQKTKVIQPLYWVGEGSGRDMAWSALKELFGQYGEIQRGIAMEIAANALQLIKDH